MSPRERRLELVRLCHDLRKGDNETMDIVRRYEAFIDELPPEGGAGAGSAAPAAPKGKAKT